MIIDSMDEHLSSIYRYRNPLREVMEEVTFGPCHFHP
jgi:hypothetical protein